MAEDNNRGVLEHTTADRPVAKRYKRSVWRLVLYSIVGAIIAILLLLTTLIQLLTHTDGGKQWIVSQVNSVIQGEIRYDRMDISLLTTLPVMAIELDHLSVISSCTAISDTLLRLDRLYVEVNIASLITNGSLEISKIRLLRPSIYGWVDHQGGTSWSIYTSEPSADTTAIELPNIIVDSLIIDQGIVRFSDFKANREADVGPFTIILQGGVRGDLATLRGSVGALSINYSDSTGLQVSDTPLSVALDLEVSNSFHYFRWSSLGVRLDQLAITSQGGVEASADYKSWQSDINFSLTSGSFSNLLSYLPAPYRKILDSYKLEGRLDSHGYIKGLYSGTHYPVIHYQIDAQGVRAGVKESDQQLDHGVIKGAIHLDLNDRERSSLRLDQLHLSSGGSKIEASGQVGRLFKNQQIDFVVKANVCLGEITALVPQMRSYNLEGELQADLDGEFNMSDLLSQRWSKLDITGGMRLDNLNLTNSTDSLSVYISAAELKLGANQASRRDANRKILIGGKLTIDSLYLAHASRLQFGIGGFKLTSHATNLGANKLPSSHIAMRWSSLNSKLRDSLTVTSSTGGAIVAITADRVNKNIPRGIVSFELSKFRIRQPGSRISTDSTGFKIQITPRERRRRKQQQIAAPSSKIIDLDSLYRLVVRTVKHPNPSEEFARRFHIKGDSYSRSFRMKTPYLPLRTSVKNFSFKFTEDTLHLEKLQVKVGHSDVALRGAVANFRRALLYNRGELKADFEMTSSLLDINELLRAVNKGNQYRAQRDQTPTAELENREVDEGVSEDDDMGLFVVPPRWNLLFKTDARRVIFGKMDMREFQGDAYLKGGALRINDLSVRTGLGNLLMDVLYECKTSDSAKVGASLALDKVRLDSLVEQLPVLDSIVPMLRSFEGVVDCQISALANVDSLFNVKLPSVNAAAWLRGQNLVLLDGQDFAEIAKMLMFKNKKRNVIDSISVEMVVRNNQMEILPFVFEMDRYKAAVGGTHGFDMNFNYHISLLRSPIPFKLGVNVFGSLEKPKFRLVAPKYSDPKKAVKVGTLLDGKVNIRQELQRALDRTISEIIE